MKCPLCNTEERIVSNKNILKGGKLYRRMVFSCLNTSCDNFNKELHKEDVELEVENIDEEAEAEAETETE